jgi:Uncharacterized proteins, homologs of microcin C7 resistance protein MccF
MKAASTAIFAFAVLGLLLWHRTGYNEPQKEEDVPVYRPLLDDADFLAELDKSGSRGRNGIRIVAPGSGLHGDNTDKAYRLAQKMGVELPRGALDPEAVPYTANADEARLAMFLDALDDPEAEVLWALRGGYGSSRLLPELARRGLSRPKLFVGYSDMTFLHLFFQTRGWRTIHGSMFWELSGSSAEDENFLILAELLSGGRKELRYDVLTPFNDAAKNAALPLDGLLTGGNLTCIASAVGTPWQLDAGGKILFLEDVKESGYKIDRMLTQLRLAGQLDGVKAVVFGTFSRGDEHTNFSLERFARECDIPIFKADIFGHGSKNYPLVFNAPAMLEKNDGREGGVTLKIQADQLPLGE